MPFIKVPVKRTSQPQGAVEIDWGHPLSSHLFRAFLAPSRELKTGAAPTAGLPLAATVDGIAISNASSTSTYSWSGNSSPETTEATILVRAMRGGAQPDSGFGLAVTLVQASGTQDPFQLFIKDSGERIRFNTTTNDTTEHSESAVDWPVGVFQTGVYTYKSGVGAKAYRNGALTTFSSDALAGRTGTLKPAISTRISLSALRFNGAVSLVLVFSKALSTSEIKSISDNPWQLFKPVSRSLWIPGTVSGGGEATVIPIGQQATGSVGTLVATGAAKALPAGVSASSAVGTPVAVGGSSIPATVTPAGVSATGSVGTATVTGQAKASPSGVSATASVGSPVALAGGAAVATPAGVQAVGAVGNLIATGAAWVVPGGVSASGAVGTPVASGGVAVSAVAYPVGLAGFWSVGTPTINTAGIEAVSGAVTRSSRIQVSNRAPRYQTGARHAR